MAEIIPVKQLELGEANETAQLFSIEKLGKRIFRYISQYIRGANLCALL